MKLTENRDQMKSCCIGFWQRRMHISITDWHWKVAVKCTREKCFARAALEKFTQHLSNKYITEQTRNG